MLTNGVTSDNNIPIVIPIGVESANETKRAKALPNLNPERENVPPREIEATALCRPMLSTMYPVNAKSVWMPTAIPSKIECVIKAITSKTEDVLLTVTSGS